MHDPLQNNEWRSPYFFAVFAGAYVLVGIFYQVTGIRDWIALRDSGGFYRFLIYGTKAIIAYMTARSFRLHYANKR